MEHLYRTELEYLKCFAEFTEDDIRIRFTDLLIADMYSHNVTYLKSELGDIEFKRFLQKELDDAMNRGKGFYNLHFDFPFRASLLKNLEIQPSEQCTYDYYMFPIDKLDQSNVRLDCHMRKLDYSLVQAALQLDLEANGPESGNDFVQRRFKRRSKVYLEPGKVDNYLCIHGEKAIGHSDLFINQDVAKIEDFNIVANEQRKGFGSAMAKEMIQIAISKGANTIYLITDHDDTAKDMYEKCGFVKVAEKTEMLFFFKR